MGEYRWGVGVVQAPEGWPNPRRPCILTLMNVSLDEAVGPCSTPEDYADAVSLTKEYAAWLGFDLGFQGFDRELAEFPAMYGSPEGAFLLARFGGAVAGGVGLRRLAPGVCEMKRLFVRERFKGRGLGRALCVKLVARARVLGYKTMRLDTLARMEPALALYRSLGFVDITPYRHNPEPGACFLELDLTPRIRPARPDELDAVYLLGYDAWGEGAAEAAYLSECRASPKYARGRWWVFEEGRAPVSALIVYRDAWGLPQGSWGLGSLATAKSLRRKGLAAKLIEGVLEEEKGPAFLFADIGPKFYTVFGFVALPEAMQPKAGTTLMYRGPTPAIFKAPSYF